MSKYFQIEFEFDRAQITPQIHTSSKGYVCLIEANNLSEATLNPAFKEVVDGALFNVCDGSNIALLLTLLKGRKLKAYPGAELFQDILQMRSYKHAFIGNTEEILRALKSRLVEIDPAIVHALFLELPFRTVEAFDYPSIAAQINELSPDCIWVSLGAPKQELFMSRLLPYLNRGVLFGVGAAFNFHSGIPAYRRAPLWMRRLNMEWLYRVYQEPQKSIPRYARFLRILPTLIYNELKSS